MPLCRALIKLHILNAGNLNPDPLYAAINFSHPQLTERLKALRFDPEDAAAEVEIEPVKDDYEAGNIVSVNDDKGEYKELNEV